MNTDYKILYRKWIDGKCHSITQSFGHPRSNEIYQARRKARELDKQKQLEINLQYQQQYWDSLKA